MSNKEPIEEYEERVVAFLDILGFTKTIKKTESDITELKKLISLLSRINEGVINLKTEDKNPADIRMSVFSDSIIISCALNGSIDIFARQLLQINIWLIEQDYFVRGGVDFGKVYHKDNMVFGPAFIKACELEKLANYPRIVLSDKAKETMSPIKNDNGSITVTTAALTKKLYFSKDCDGLYYVDYFNVGNIDEKYKNFIVNLEKLIDKNIKEHSKDESIVAKMAWITNKIALVGEQNNQNIIHLVDDFV